MFSVTTSKKVKNHYQKKCYFQLSPQKKIPNLPQKTTRNTKNIEKCIKFYPPDSCPPEHGV